MIFMYRGQGGIVVEKETICFECGETGRIIAQCGKCREFGCRKLVGIYM